MVRIDTAITKDALNRLEQHWAVKAVSDDQCACALEVAVVCMMRSAIGCQMKIDFDEFAIDEETVKRVAMAYEIAAIEGLDALLHPSSSEGSVQLRSQALAGAFRAYSLRRTLPIPEEPESRIFHVLQLAALAYCGNQWADLHRWLKDHEREVLLPAVHDSSWDHQLLWQLYECWVRLMRKQGRDDLNEVGKIVAKLRRDQKQYEDKYLDTLDNALAQAAALRLIALYHWAKATELLAVYMLQGQPASIEAELDKHFEAAQQAALTGQDVRLGVMLRWLHVTSRRMVADLL